MAELRQRGQTSRGNQKAWSHSPHQGSTRRRWRVASQNGALAWVIGASRRAGRAACASPAGVMGVPSFDRASSS